MFRNESYNIIKLNGKHFFFFNLCSLSEMHYHDGNGIGSPVEIVPTRGGKYKIVNDLQETARMHKVYTAKKKN